MWKVNERFAHQVPYLPPEAWSFAHKWELDFELDGVTLQEGRREGDLKDHYI